MVLERENTHTDTHSQRQRQRYKEEDGETGGSGGRGESGKERGGGGTGGKGGAGGGGEKKPDRHTHRCFLSVKQNCVPNKSLCLELSPSILLLATENHGAPGNIYPPIIL